MKIFTRSALMGAAATVALAGTAAAGDEPVVGFEAEAAAVEASTAAVAADSPIQRNFRLRNAEPLDVAAFLDGLGLTGAVTFESEEFDRRRGATVLSNVAIGGPSGITAGSIEIFGLDEAAVTSLTAGGLAEKTDLFRKIRLYDVSGSFPIPDETTGTVTNAELTLEALELDTLALSTPDTSAMEGNQGFAAMANGMSLGGMAMEGLSLSMAQEGFAFDVETGMLIFGGYENGRMKALEAEDFSFGMKQSEAFVDETVTEMGPMAGIFGNEALRTVFFPTDQVQKIGRMTWDGMSIEGLLSYFERGETPPTDARNLISVGKMEFLDFVAMIDGEQYTETRRQTIDPIEFTHYMPRRIHMETVGTTTDLTVFAKDAPESVLSVLETNGLDEVKGDSTLTMEYDQRNQRITLDSEGKAEGLTAMTFNMEMGSFDYPALVEGASETAATQITFNGMSLVIEDDRLVDTLFALAGASMEQDPSALRQQVQGLVTIGAMQGGAFSPRIPSYATAVSTFIGEGGTLEIKADPEAPVTIESLTAASEANPGSLLDLLNVTVEQD